MCFFAVLDQCGALPILFPHLKPNGPGINALTIASLLTDDAAIRFAALLHALPEDNEEKSDAKKVIADICNRYRVPNAYRELAQLTALHVEEAWQASKFSGSNEERIEALHFFEPKYAFEPSMEKQHPMWVDVNGQYHIKDLPAKHLLHLFSALNIYNAVLPATCKLSFV